jgi:hypothetical protein
MVISCRRWRPRQRQRRSERPSKSTTPRSPQRHKIPVQLPLWRIGRRVRVQLWLRCQLPPFCTGVPVQILHLLPEHRIVIDSHRQGISLPELIGPVFQINPVLLQFRWLFRLQHLLEAMRGVRQQSRLYFRQRVRLRDMSHEVDMVGHDDKPVHHCPLLFHQEPQRLDHHVFHVVFL